MLKDQEDFAAVLLAYMERAEGEGVKYAEIMIDVQNHLANGVAFDIIWKGMHLGMSRHKGQIMVRFVVSLVGERDPNEALEVVEKCKDY